MSAPDADERDNERSPLISPSPKGNNDDDVEESRWLSETSSVSDADVHLEDSIVESRSVLYLIFLTLSLGGLQIVWSVELSNGSPYLLSLGMSKALVAFVWLAGPMTGVLVQPYVGMLSDRCRVKWGKRKPFMLGGMLGTVGASLLLSYARQIVQVIGGWKNDDPYDGWWQGITLAFATFMMWVLDFAINTVQAAIRAFIVDGAPAHQQEPANAWASRITGVGSILGYMFGYLDLPKRFTFLGREQFQVLCAIASIALSTTVLISVLTIKERNPQDEPPPKEDSQSGVTSFFRRVWKSILRLPPPIRRVCEIQFFNWMGFFPFLYYITTYIGQIYLNPDLNPDLSPDEVSRLWAKATRVGTFGLVVFAMVSFVSNVFLPFLVEPTYKAKEDYHAVAPVTPTSPLGTRPFNTSTTDLTQISPASPTSAGRSVQRAYLDRMLEKLQIPGFTLRRAWMLSQIVYSLCMFSTFFISSTTAAIVMVGFIGIPWSLTLWAPFALISAEISKRAEERRKSHRRKLLNGSAVSYVHGQNDTDEDDECAAGIILGLHNVAVSSPQVIATLICSVVFKMLQKPRNEPDDVSVAWTLRLGGIATLASAFLTWRMRESVVAEPGS